MFLLLNTGKGNRQIENTGNFFYYSCLTTILIKVTNSRKNQPHECMSWVFLLSKRLLEYLRFIYQKIKIPNISNRDGWVVPPGLEPGTQGFSVLCSTN